MILENGVDGNWGDWVDQSSCDVTCGGGRKRQSRVCNNPLPSNGGSECLFSDGSGLRGKGEVKTVACNTDNCRGKLLFSQFSILLF